MMVDSRENKREEPPALLVRSAEGDRAYPALGDDEESTRARAWLRQRESVDEACCRHSGCLADLFVDRIRALEAAIDDYMLWEPGRRGHAEAHRKLMEVRRG